MTRQIKDLNIELNGYYLRRGVTGRLILGVSFTPFFVVYLNDQFQVIRGVGSIEEGTYHFVETDFETFNSLKETVETIKEV